MKQKTHSGAKKRLRLKPSGKVKRSRPNRRHLLEHKTSKSKRSLAKKTYVNDASQYQVERLLVF